MFAHPHITNVPSGLCRKEHGINNKEFLLYDNSNYYQIQKELIYRPFYTFQFQYIFFEIKIKYSFKF